MVSTPIDAFSFSRSLSSLRSRIFFPPWSVGDRSQEREIDFHCKLSRTKNVRSAMRERRGKEGTIALQHSNPRPIRRRRNPIWRMSIGRNERKSPPGNRTRCSQHFPLRQSTHTWPVTVMASNSDASSNTLTCSIYKISSKENASYSLSLSI